MTFTHDELAAAWLRWNGRPVTAANLAGVTQTRTVSQLVLMLARRNALPQEGGHDAAACVA